MKNYKNDFPVYEKHPNLVYLDNAASSLKPKVTIDEMVYYYEALGVNVNRGVYNLSYEATNLYENARVVVADFINAKEEEIVFTRGATAALNLVALTYGMDNIKENDEIVISEVEHHSSSMPWRYVAKIKKAKIVYVPLTKEGKITIKNFESVLTKKTKVVALTHVSNVLGYKTPIKEIIDLSHSTGAIITIDGAQSVPHMKIDVKALDCDFLSFSGHKMAAPTGVGVLYGKKEILDIMRPLEFGGDMADKVDKDTMTFKDTPFKFEAGTPIIAEVIGLAKAIGYLKSIGMEKIYEIERDLKKYAMSKLKDIKGITIYNPGLDSNLITFNLDGIHPHDAASIFDKNEVCVRAGVHCAQPVHIFLKIDSSLRCSFYFYNDFSDVDKFVDSIKEAIKFFKKF